MPVPPIATWEQNLERYKQARDVVLEMQQQSNDQYLSFLTEMSELILSHRERLAEISQQRDSGITGPAKPAAGVP